MSNTASTVLIQMGWKTLSVLSSLREFKWYFSEPATLSSLAHCWEDLMGKSLWENTESQHKLIPSTLFYAVLHFKCHRRKPDFSFTPMFLSCFVLLFVCFTWCKTHQKRSESLDANSRKNTNKCEISTAREKNSLNRLLSLSSFPHHCHSLWYVLSFSVSSDLELIRGMSGSDADFPLASVCAQIQAL